MPYEMRDRRRRGIGIGAMGRGPIYGLSDDFITAVSAPLAASRLAEAGPGVMVKLNDTNNRASITGGKLKMTGTIAAQATDPGYYWRKNDGSGWARGEGRITVYKGLAFFTNTSRGTHIGLVNTASYALSNTAAGVYFVAGGNFNVGAGTPSVAIGVWAVNTYNVAIVKYETGYSFYIQGGAFTNWTLLFTLEDGTDATVYPMIGGATNTDHELDKVIAVDVVGSALTTLYGLATVNVINPTSGAVVVATADGQFDVFFTLPAGSANLVAVDIQFNYTDATHYNSLQIKRNAGNTAWDMVKAEYAGAGAANVVTVTGVGTPIGLRCQKIADKQRYFTKASTTWTPRSTEQTVTNEQSATGLNVTFSGATVTRLVSQPITSNEYSILGQV